MTIAIILPVSLQGQNPDMAMLHASGGVQVNGSAALASSAIFPKDRVQTLRNAVAKIDVSGSTAVVAPDSLIQFEGNELILEHGTVQVSTSTKMTVRVGCITAIPIIATWTQYEVTDVDSKVTVFARKNDVNIDQRNKASRLKSENAHSEKATVREGEQATREEKCAAAIRAPDYVTGKKALLDTWEGVTAGLVVVGVIACLGICHDDDPASPSDP